MADDPIVEEVHQIRREQAAKFGFDTEAIVRDAQSREGQDGHCVVELSPKRIKLAGTAPKDSVPKEK